MVVRTPGRRFWEARLPIRLGGFIAICMLSVSLWFVYDRVRLLETPHNPHYRANHCDDCHQGTTKHTKDAECYECHDVRTRALNKRGLEHQVVLRSGAVSCAHDIKREEVEENRTVTALCLSCHKKITGYVAMIDISSGRYVEVDMAETHPIGLMPTDTIFPRTLPLSKETGAINCVTCHDQHAADKRLRMLRYYYPGNGHPADFRPLCLDCHTDGWLPLKMRPKAVREAKKTPESQIH